MSQLDQTLVSSVIEHMNADHSDAVLCYVQAFSVYTDATDAKLTSIDSSGMDILCSVAAGVQPVRICFDKPVDSANSIRQTLIELGVQGRARLAGSPATP